MPIRTFQLPERPPGMPGARRRLSPQAGSALRALVEAARQRLSASGAAISLPDGDRQVFAPRVGIVTGSVPRAVAICGHAMQQRGVFVVADLASDPRFEGNPLVLGDPQLRFYAGAPLATPDREPYGVLCVLDSRSHAALSAGEAAALAELAAQAAAIIANDPAD